MPEAHFNTRQTATINEQVKIYKQSKDGSPHDTCTPSGLKADMSSSLSDQNSMNQQQQKIQTTFHV